MKAKRWKGVLAVAAIAGILALSGCPQPEGGGTDTYTVTFNANGGTPAPAAQDVADGGKITAPVAPAKTGFTFGGWFKESTVTNQWDFATDTVTADITLYAKWDTVVGTYTVTFNANGGTPAPAVQNVAGGGKVTVPTAPAKTGFTFGGWYKESGLIDLWDFTTDTVTTDITLYAKWVDDSHWGVAWVLNGGAWGEGTTPPGEVLKGSAVPEPAAPAKPGFTFGGWYTETALTSPWNFAAAVTADITLYAKWDTVVGTYTVTFNANGGDSTPAAQTVAEGGKTAEPTAPGKTGFSFAGWYKEAGLTNRWDFDTDTVTTDITLYAKWDTVVTYTVTFNANGGDSTPAAQTVAEGGKAAEPTAPGKTGFSLAGWYKEAGLISRWDFATDTVTGNLTLYARWTYNFTTPAQYRETSSLAGGTITGNSAYYYSSSDLYKGVFIENRTVMLSPFTVAKYETTYELWYEVRQWAASNGYTFANAGWEGNDGIDGPSPSAAKTEPVTSVNWRDAVVWCNAYSEMNGKGPVYYTDSGYTTVLRTSTNEGGTGTAADGAVMKPGANGYRLPTEAEWEYAARGGGTPSPSGPFVYTWAGTDSESSLGSYAWYYDSSWGATHQVGTKLANDAQVYDMSGNVDEWCWDWYADSVGTGTVSNPTGADAGTRRVARGGSWFVGASYCAVAFRNSVTPDDRRHIVGFRVVCAP